ncbi:MAG: hypothetical protein LBO20_04520 [Bifidobacteriaceae bacterium]|nr:hypothetical protein [Bifidobacteriaceae bacterium]
MTLFELPGETAVEYGQWRLALIEVANWGTFQGLHRVPVAREGFLLTGASGSGKSSLLDAVAAGLMPRGKVHFNAAASEVGGRRDRTVLSYVRGAWRRHENEDTGEVSSDYLRPGATWSGINLQFDNGASGEPLSLVKLYHVSAGGSEPADVKELGLVWAGPISLKECEPFAKDGLDVSRIKKRWPGVFASNKPGAFGQRLTRELGIASAEALELWHKTQSAKSLGSLNSLFRDYMLDLPETFAIAKAACAQFGELKQAHAAVVDARQQVEALEPLRGLGREHAASVEAQTRLEALEQALNVYAQAERLRLARIELDESSREVDQAEAEAARAAVETTQAQQAHDAAHQAALGMGGAALARLESVRDQARTAHQTVAARRAEWLTDLGAARIEAPASAEQFQELKRQAVAELASFDGSELLESLQREAGRVNAAGVELKALHDEIEVVRRSKSNLGADLLRARALVLEATGLGPASLPFAGELMQVKTEFEDWTGAIERALRPLARVMLVPAAQRAAVTEAANRQHLGTRLVMEFVGAETLPVPSCRAARPLPARLEVKPGTFFNWLQATLRRDYDYDCSPDLEAFVAAPKAVTREGQVKRGRTRQEKDDRWPIGDRSRWVLGFDNQDKLDRLADRVKELAAARAKAQQAYDAFQREREQQGLRRRVFERLEALEWPQVDEASVANVLETAERELSEFRASNRDLRAAEHKEREAAETLEAARGRLRSAELRAGLARDRREKAADAIVQVEAEATGPEPAPDPEVVTELRERFDAARGRRSLTYRDIGELKDKVRAGLTAESRQVAHRADLAVRRIERCAHDYRSRWPAPAAELADSVEDLPGYLELLERLERDGLPAFEDRFFELLAKQSTQNVGQLADTIRRAPGQVRDKTRVINGALAESAFDVGRHLKIEVRDCQSAAARDFLGQLRSITSGSWAQTRGQAEVEREEAEARFAAIDAVMTRLGSDAPSDLRWRDQCLDTRRHVRFVGKEIDSDGQVVAVHDSAAGLSGGQQQKLAFFCLAAALRFRLTEDAARVPSFGTVVMDEAFDRADADFTRMALEVFRQFGFHMVLATPLKAITVMEDYIRGVGHVSCADGRSSRVALVEIAAASVPVGDAVPAVAVAAGASPAGPAPRAHAVPAAAGTAQASHAAVAVAAARVAVSAGGIAGTDAADAFQVDDAVAAVSPANSVGSAQGAASSAAGTEPPNRDLPGPADG